MKFILLIENNSEVCTGMREILELAGYRVVEAGDGKAGVKVALEQRPDLIISAVDLPGLDGFGVLHLIRSRPEFINIPFIFLTETIERDEFRKGMDMGADDFIIKPFTDSELLNAVQSRLVKAEHIKKLAATEVQTTLSTEYTYKMTQDRLLKNAIPASYKKKQVIFGEGNYPQTVFYIKKGKVKAVKNNEDGKELTVGLYTAGDFVGYIALLENSGYRVTAIALENCELLLISREDFLNEIQSNAAFALEFTKVLVDKNNYKADQMVLLAYDSLRKRVANTLILLKNQFVEEGQKQIKIRMTREELAQLAGTTTESLIRTLSDFRAEKLIEIDGRSIEILNEHGLENMLN